jgi:hypothetical protein
LPNYGSNCNEVQEMAQEEPLWNIKDWEPYWIRAGLTWQYTNSTPEAVVALVDLGLTATANDGFRM